MKTSTSKSQEAPKAARDASQAVTQNSDKPVKKRKTEDRRLYVGPTIYGVARHGSVYIGIPSGAETARKDVPDFIHLFIPITDYGKAMEQIRKGIGYISVAYKHAEVYADKVRNGGIR